MTKLFQSVQNGNYGTLEGQIMPSYLKISSAILF